MLWILFILMTLFTITDIKWFFIPNLIVLPTILIGGCLTNNWLYGALLFMMGAWLYNKKRWRGGDVKLVCMVGMFLGWLAIPVMFTTMLLTKVYRKIRHDYWNPIPVAPFLLLATIGNILIVKSFAIWNP